jgi:hypothetical protein
MQSFWHASIVLYGKDRNVERTLEATIGIRLGCGVIPEHNCNIESIHERDRLNCDFIASRSDVT